MGVRSLQSDWHVCIRGLLHHQSEGNETSIHLYFLIQDILIAIRFFRIFVPSTRQNERKRKQKNGRSMEWNGTHASSHGTRPRVPSNAVVQCNAKAYSSISTRL